jgi:16S rRNA (guanine966-N2)-methyltransferase
MTYGFIRIVGGAYRGRKLKVADLAGVRPTPDRVRETLFNWLQPVIAGAHCLDLFAGSGALGFESLSRGAASVVMVDQSAPVIDLLRQQMIEFGAKNADIYKATVPHQLKKPAALFDVVFIDPPFQEDLLSPCCTYLEENSFLADNAYIYLEAKETVTAEMLPANWELIKSKKAGLVAYHLALRKHK